MRDLSMGISGSCEILDFSSTPCLRACSRSIEITTLDADWYWTVELAGTVALSKRIRQISFVPSLANDRLILREGSITGATIFETGICGDRGLRVEYNQKPLNIDIVMDVSECVIDTPANAKIVVKIE